MKTGRTSRWEKCVVLCVDHFFVVFLVCVVTSALAAVNFKPIHTGKRIRLSWAKR